jgi:RNA polymerase I-specific transcription initiation factor RRN3
VYKPTRSRFVCSLLRLVPSVSSCIFPLLLEHFPHKSAPTALLTHYVKLLLVLAETAPVLRDRILSGVMERLIQLDVAIKNEADEQESAERARYSRMWDHKKVGRSSHPIT